MHGQRKEQGDSRIMKKGKGRSNTKKKGWVDARVEWQKRIKRRKGQAIK